MERSAGSEGSPRHQEKCSSRSENQKAEWEKHRSSELLAQTPQPEILGGGGVAEHWDLGSGAVRSCLLAHGGPDLWVAGANHCNYPWLQTWCGLPQLGISEQKLLADPTISEGIIEKDTTMEPHLMVLSLLWGHTHPAATTAKHSKRCPYAWSLSLPRNLQLRAPSSHILSGLSRTRCFLHDFTGDGANHQSYL